MAAAIELSKSCPPSASAFSVGAILVSADGEQLADGYSRESDPHVHAEESVLNKLSGHVDLMGAIMYSSVEPCTIRKSRPRPCTQLIISAGISRVVFAWREPALLVANCTGAEDLAVAGIDVVEISELSSLVAEVNRHLLA
ncbi:dCMP deaminase [Acrocarpospora sp. B8E8]|uniref:dCMP deaminase n=1 Tax=Acrocarpospora sp. B8E8 TaxID=3153572 RepID=UPI00325D5D23